MANRRRWRREKREKERKRKKNRQTLSYCRLHLANPARCLSGLELFSKVRNVSVNEACEVGDCVMVNRDLRYYVAVESVSALNVCLAPLHLEYGEEKERK